MELNEKVGHTLTINTSLHSNTAGLRSTETKVCKVKKSCRIIVSAPRCKCRKWMR